MARAKKDGKYLNLKIETEVYDKLNAYAEEKGQTKTVALERILKAFFAEKDSSKN